LHDAADDREQEAEMERLVADINFCDQEILDLKSQISSKQQTVTNAKISQSMRLAQISRLSGLSQPIELDHTYFFVDRFPYDSSSQPPRGSSSSLSVPRQKTEHLQKLGIMRTGEGVLLEARLNEISTLLEGYLFSFNSMASTINVNPNNHIFNSAETISLRVQTEDHLKDFEKTEQRYSLPPSLSL
jgi:hypothetical protein